MRNSFLVLMVASQLTSVGWADYWTQPMSDVHASFTGEPGTIARFGDSIFVSQAFFVPLRSSHQNVPPDTQVALDWIQGYVPSNVWGWQSPETGAAGGTTTDWPLQSDQNPPERNIDHWLTSLNPEMALIMWGTNDVSLIGSVDAYVANLREIVRTVKENGTIPILTSIPPRSDYEVASDEYAQAVTNLAQEEGVPSMTYHEEILDRAPGDTWDGSLVYDGTGSVFQVERLVSGDGIHPSNPTAFRRNFSEDALNKSGYTLLNYLALHATFDVYQQVIAPDSVAVLGDYNDEGIVDAADYTIWRDNLGAASLPNRNPDVEGVVGQADYEFWKSQFGVSGSASLAANVPEPTTVLLGLIAAMATLAVRRR